MNIVLVLTMKIYMFGDTMYLTPMYVYFIFCRWILIRYAFAPRIHYQLKLNSRSKLPLTVDEEQIKAEWNEGVFWSSTLCVGKQNSGFCCGSVERIYEHMIKPDNNRTFIRCVALLTIVFNWNKSRNICFVLCISSSIQSVSLTWSKQRTPTALNSSPKTTHSSLPFATR